MAPNAERPNATQIIATKCRLPQLDRSVLLPFLSYPIKASQAMNRGMKKFRTTAIPCQEKRPLNHGGITQDCAHVFFVQVDNQSKLPGRKASRRLEQQSYCASCARTRKKDRKSVRVGK